MLRNSRFWGRVGNTILFYIGWLVVAMEAAEGHAWSGVFVIGAIVVLHLYFVRDMRCEVIIMTTFAVVGTLMDTFYSAIGFIEYKAGYQHIPWLAPPWLTAMWVLFATSVNHAFEWMHNRWPIAAVFGAGGGTLTYLGAIRLGAAKFLINPLIGTIILAVIWTFAFPICLQFSVWVQKKYSVYKK